jgi:molybdate transport system substrate-binding protein
MVLTKKARETVRQFYTWLQQPASRAIFKRYGFVLPGEATN